MAPHPAVFVRVASKGLTGYGTWKSAETPENKELIFALTARDAGSEARQQGVAPFPPINVARISKEKTYGMGGWGATTCCRASFPVSRAVSANISSLFSGVSALFQVPYPVSPLLATLTKTAGCGAILPELERRKAQLEAAMRY